MVETKEILDNKDKVHEKELKLYKSQASNSNFAVGQFKTRVEELAKEATDKSRKISEFHKFDAVVTVPFGSRKKSFTFRRSRMEMDAPVPSRAKSTKPAGKKREPQSTNLLRIIENQAATLASELSELQTQLQEQAEQCADLEEKVQHRDQEIERLRKMLNGGMPPAAVIKETDQDKINELQNKVKSLESELKASTDKQHEAMKHAVKAAKKCERLEREMKDMDKVACTISHEKTLLAKKITQTEEELSSYELLNRELRDKVRRMKEETSGADTGSKEKRHLEKKIDSLNMKIKEMNGRERELMLEIQRLSSRHICRERGSQRGTSKEKRPSSKSARKSPDSDGETRPKELEEPWLGENLNQKETAEKIDRLERERDQLTSECRRLETEVSRIANSAQPLSEKDKELVALQQSTTNLTREVASLKSQISSHASAESSSALTTKVAQLE
ncbi:hypothetical protein B566_EDAN003950, partial [Ephemera danica]